jgi:hypothetical protein
VAGFSDGDLAGPNAGGSDSWLLRLSPAGEERWRVALGSAGNDEIEDVAVAGDGTIFLAGATTGELAAPGAGGWDLILVALAPDGSERWRVQDGTAQDDRAYVASLAPDGGVYVGLHTQGDLAGPNEGGWDGALRRYDADGAAVWTRHLAHPENLYVLGLASGPDGGAVVAGAGPEGPDDGADVPGFVRAFDADGAERWATAFGPGRRDMPRPVAVAGDGTAFVAATTEADLAGPQAGIADAALLAWGPDGSERWATQLGSPRFEDAVAVAATSDAVLLAGTTQGPLPGAPDDGFDNDGYLMRFPY